MIGETVCKVFHIEEPVAKGLALQAQLPMQSEQQELWKWDRLKGQ